MYCNSLRPHSNAVRAYDITEGSFAKVTQTKQIVYQHSLIELINEGYKGKKFRVTKCGKRLITTNR